MFRVHICIQLVMPKISAKRCLAIRKVVAALNKYVRGVSQIFAYTNCQVASYQLVGKRKQNMSGRVEVPRQS